MAYCRWSSDNWRCDLYCYEDVVGGFTTHVAGRRRVGVEALPPNPLDELVQGKIDPDEWHRRYREHHEKLKALPFEDIELPHAGETFRDGDLESFKERLLHLRQVGYHFPDRVLETIDQEIKDAISESKTR